MFRYLTLVISSTNLCAYIPLHYKRLQSLQRHDGSTSLLLTAQKVCSWRLKPIQRSWPIIPTYVYQALEFSIQFGILYTRLLSFPSGILYGHYWWLQGRKMDYVLLCPDTCSHLWLSLVSTLLSPVSTLLSLHLVRLEFTWRIRGKYSVHLFDTSLYLS